jgi:hypothetical protein
MKGRSFVVNIEGMLVLGERVRRFRNVAMMRRVTFSLMADLAMLVSREMMLYFLGRC